MDMATEIANGHGYLGYAVLVAVLVVVLLAVARGRRGAPYSEGLPRLVGLLVALQWVYGIVVYVQVAAWESGWLLSMLHPLAMTGAVALSGIATSRARDAGEPGAQWSTLARLFGIMLVLIVIGVVAAVAG